MPAVIVRTYPSDLDAWLEQHIGSHELLRSGGFVRETIYRDVDDPEALVVVMEIEDIDRWRRFVESPAAQAEIGAAPLKRGPEMTIGEEVRLAPD